MYPGSLHWERADRIQSGGPGSATLDTNQTRKGWEGDEQASGWASEESLPEEVAFQLRSN